MININLQNPGELVQGSQVSDYGRINVESLGKITADLEEKGILEYSYPSAKLSSLINGGYHFCNLHSQRPVDIKHIQELGKSLIAAGVNEFSAKGIATPAVVALEAGVELVDAITGKEVNLETPDVDKYLLIIDMQHRFATCQIRGDLDMKVIITDCATDPTAMVLNHNKSQKGWGSDDFRYHFSQKENKLDELHVATEEAEKIFPGCSQKAYEYALTGKKDAVRKSEVQKGNIPNLDAEAKEIGFDVLRFLRLLSNDEQKGKRLETFTAIFNGKASLANSIAGREFGKLLLCLAHEIKDTEKAKSMISDISKADWSEFEKGLTKATKDFRKAHKDELDTLYQTAVEEFDKKYSGTSAAPSTFKDAPLADVLKQNAEKEKAKAEAKKKKAELEEKIKELKKEADIQARNLKNLEIFD